MEKNIFISNQQKGSRTFEILNLKDKQQQKISPKRCLLTLVSVMGLSTTRPWVKTAKHPG